MNKIIYSILLFVLLYNIIYSKDIFEHQPNRFRRYRRKSGGSKNEKKLKLTKKGKIFTKKGGKLKRTKKGKIFNMISKRKQRKMMINNSSNDTPILVKLKENKISPHQICYRDENDNIHRYTNYNINLRTTLEKHVIDNNSNIKILNNDIEIDNKKYKLFECGKSNGDLDLDNDNIYTSDILNNTHKCKKISDTYGFISKGNNKKDSWGGDDICNRIVSYKGKYFHEAKDTNWPTTGGCTIYSDDKCQKIKEVVDFEGNPPGNYPPEFKDKYKKEIAARN